ncbi:MAG TPA: CHAP domain-containing protein, partial [Duganella sp.]|nr:CHAP domain-containing protein [Duganella sp.]
MVYLAAAGRFTRLRTAHDVANPTAFSQICTQLSGHHHYSLSSLIEGVSMPIFRLAVSIVVMAMFAYGAVSIVSAPVPTVAKSAKRIAANCPVEKQMAGGRCACDGQTNWSAAPCVPRPATVSRRVGTVMLGRELHSDNCVFFVRDRVPSLPYGLGTWTGKLAIINAHAPQPGDVAIINVGSGVYKDVGHVAIIEEVTDSTITILEGN